MPVVEILFVLLLVLALASSKLFNSLRKMEIQMGVGVMLAKYDSPLLFWAVIAVQCLLVSGLLAIILWSIFCLPNHTMS